MSEALLQDRIRKAVGLDPDLILWRNNVGNALTFDGRRIQFGVGNPGGADLIGIFRGRFVAAEIKTETGRQSAEQRAFQRLVERRGGIYVVLRSVDDALAWLQSLRSQT